MPARTGRSKNSSPSLSMLGAGRVAILLPADFHEQAATIAVIDDSEGMGAEGLKQHWLVGKSLKRELGQLPLGRQQIGKFGIGKLATYVLANRLSHGPDDHVRCSLLLLCHQP